MRLRILFIIVVLMAFFSCVKHDIDPKLQPFIFLPGDRTVFTRDVPNAHLVCMVTEQYQHAEACVTLKQVRALILQQQAGL